LVVVSQSGETADTLAAVEAGREKGTPVLAVCNVVDSSIARRASAVLYTHAGPEISVASTKAFTTQLTALYLLALHLGRQRGLVDAERGRKLLGDLVALPHAVKDILAREAAIERVAKKYGKASDVLYLGRGINYPVALEGALKLKEISYIHAEGYPAGEMKHGPIALINEEMPVVVIIPHDAVFQKSLSNLKEVESRGGRIIVVTDAPSPELEEIRAGRMIVLMDDEDSENEGDLCAAAERVTAEHNNIMATHGRGLICLSLTEERCEQLGLSMMVKDNRAPLGTAFTVSIDARQGVARGISAIDRATTIRTAI